MPYISEEDRSRVEAHGPRTPGELNYAITKIVLEYYHRNPPSYASINECIGALECAKQEFYRRVAVPYEMQKIADNGDVYGKH